MKAWKIRYTTRDNNDTFDCVTYLESNTLPTAEDRLRCILQEQSIRDNNPMENYDDINWIYDYDWTRIDIMDCEQVPTQRLIRVWYEAGGVYVGDRDCVLRRFPVSDDGYELMAGLANLLRSLGYIVSMHAGRQRWFD